MTAEILNTRSHRWWAFVPLSALLWHSFHTAFYLHPHYLLFICYSANLVLGIGLIVQSPILIGTGAGWTLVGFPLWLHNAILASDWTPSSIAFHLSGLVCGVLAVKDYRLPRGTWCAGIGLALILFVLARYLTEESLNINAAFRVHSGWERVFPEYPVYLGAMAVGFSIYFILLTWANNRYRCSRPIPDEGDPLCQGSPDTVSE